VGDVSAAPMFTPFQVAPALRNREDVQRALLHFLPAVTRETATSGRVLVWVLIDTRGVVQKAQVKQSSGFAPLDRAALQVAATMKFTAELNGDQPVTVWVSVPADFSVR
jgi:TonB family protein